MLALLIILGSHVPTPPDPPLAGPELATLDFAPVPLDPRDPAARRLGRLDYLDGWVLTSASPRFGGLSSLHVANGQVLSLSDTGTLYRFALPAGPGRGREPMRIAPLGDGPGSPVYKSNRDSESMRVEGGEILVGFENRNAIWRYRLSDQRAIRHAAPAAMHGWHFNTGAEAMTRLMDGRYIVFCECPDDDKPLSDALVFDRDPSDPAARAILLHYRRVPGFRVSDAATLPDGRVMLLNRRFEWLEGFSLAVTIADLRGLGEGATIEREEIARLAPPLTVDNMEGLSLTQENGRTIVWIVSDDNFFPLQQTLLLKFALID